MQDYTDRLKNYWKSNDLTFIATLDKINDNKNHECALDTDDITNFSNEILKNEEELIRVKILVAKHWLLEVNQ